MKVIETLKEEVAKTPIGTVGSICGVITLVMDMVQTHTSDAHSGMSMPEQFAITTLKSVVISFVFAFVPGRFLDANRLSSKVLYIILALVAALLINGQFRLYFVEKGSTGGPGGVVMFFTGLLLAALYAVIYIETSSRDSERLSVSQIEGWGAFFVAVIQAFIISSRIYLPVG